MPGKKRPTDQDAATARRALLDGLARDADIFEVLSGLASLHPRNDTFPGEVFLHLAADALEWCGASRAEPLPLEGLRERCRVPHHWPVIQEEREPRIGLPPWPRPALARAA